MFRTYLINGRGDEAIGTVWSYLDMTALGRQELWEELPRQVTRKAGPTNGGTGMTATSPELLPIRNRYKCRTLAWLRFNKQKG